MMKVIRCVFCESTQVYNRAKTKDYRCIRCGKVFSEDKIKGGKE